MTEHGIDIRGVARTLTFANSLTNSMIPLRYPEASSRHLSVPFKESAWSSADCTRPNICVDVSTVAVKVSSPAGGFKVSTSFIVLSTANSTSACGMVILCCRIGWTPEISALSAEEIGRPEKEMVNSMEGCLFDEQ